MTGCTTRRNAWIVTLTALALVSAPIAVADSVKGIDYVPREEHANSDKNADGFVDRGEFHVRMVEVFYHADTDRDGLLVLVELQRIGEGMVYGPADRNSAAR